MFTSNQLKNARSLLLWSEEELAARSGLTKVEVEDFEKGVSDFPQDKVTAICDAFEDENLVFEDNTVKIALQLTFTAEDQKHEFMLTYEPDNLVVAEFLYVFGSIQGNSVELDSQQCATTELKKNLSDFVDVHSKAVPQLNKLKQFITKLDNGSYFLILPYLVSDLSSKEILEIERFVYQLNNQNAQIDMDMHDQVFGDLMEKYNMISPNTDKHSAIGPSHKHDRKCRFCNRTMEDEATFRNIAHAIPASLGNKYLKLNNECDECNGYFGRNVEPNLVELLDVQRISLDIKSRGSRPKIKTSTGQMYHDGEKVVIATQSVSKDEKGVVKAAIGKQSKIVPIKIYQALVKIALSVIPEDELPFLSQTIEWVRYDKYIDQSIPDVVSAIVNLPPDPSAQITLYVRKNDISELPHVIGEFRLGCYMYVFALPFSDKDKLDLKGFFDEQKFKDTFKHYAQSAKWQQENFSSDQEVILQINLKFKPSNAH